jgi:hypothetical protein
MREIDNPAALLRTAAFFDVVKAAQAFGGEGFPPPTEPMAIPRFVKARYKLGGTQPPRAPRLSPLRLRPLKGTRSH